jgi:hypothetical protein
VTRVSFNGGTGGTAAQPTPQEQAAANEPHVAATPTQTQHEQTASSNKTLLASVNHGNPAVAATSKPGEFSGKGVVPAKAVPPGAALPKTAPAAAALDKKGGSAGGAAPTNSGQPPKPVSNQAKPLAAVSPPKAVAPKPAPPKPVAASRPTKPSGPPPKKKPE